MRAATRAVVVLSVVVAGVPASAGPAQATCIDDPNCIRQIVCTAGEKTDRIFTELGLEPFPCD